MYRILRIVYTLDKFIKNRVKVFKGTTNPEEPEAWTLNMLKCEKTTKYLQKRCQGFLVSVVESRMEHDVDPSSVRKIKEYLDVFPEELLGLPLQRELEFSIDFYQGNSNF